MTANLKPEQLTRALLGRLSRNLYKLRATSPGCYRRDPDYLLDWVIEELHRIVEADTPALEDMWNNGKELP